VEKQSFLILTACKFIHFSHPSRLRLLTADHHILINFLSRLAYADTCKLDIRRTGGVLGMVGGGEGFFNAAVTGPGLVVSQSMNERVFLAALAAEKLRTR